MLSEGDAHRDLTNCGGELLPRCVSEPAASTRFADPEAFNCGDQRWQIVFDGCGDDVVVGVAVAMSRVVSPTSCDHPGRWACPAIHGGRSRTR